MSIDLSWLAPLPGHLLALWGPLVLGAIGIGALVGGALWLAAAGGRR